MVPGKFARHEENKVVMTKLPRDEFTNFKSICDKEDKSVNKKLRELINQEINRVSGRPAEGKTRKFFIPAENKVIEMLEVEE
jgi:hypothetical protein